MRFRLRTFFVVITLASVLVGWIVHLWRHEQNIRRRFERFGQLESAVDSGFTSITHGAISSDPTFLSQIGESPFPLLNHVAGGVDGVSSHSVGFASRPNRNQSFQIDLHYYWAPYSEAQEQGVRIVIKSSCDEQSKDEPVVYLYVAETKLSIEIANEIESELSKHEFKIVKTYSNINWDIPPPSQLPPECWVNFPTPSNLP